MKRYCWEVELKQIYQNALDGYRKGKTEKELFGAKERRQLATIGLKPIHVFDAVEDFSRHGEPSPESFLLMAAARRDYLLYMQQGRKAGVEIQMADLPGKDEKMGGIAWLPRILMKARGFLEGRLSREIMYGCGGDRNFLRKHNIHPADFLRAVWAVRGDDRKILRFLKAGKKA